MNPDTPSAKKESIRRRINESRGIIPILIGLSSISVYSCVNEQEEILRLAQIEYQRKIEVIVRSETSKCRESVISAAEEIVDSLILMSQLRPLTMDEYAPNIPTRPTFVAPDSALLKSKNIVKPIINPKRDEE